MKIKLLRLATSGFAVAGTAVGINLLNAVTPIEFLSLAHVGQRSEAAFAQNAPRATPQPTSDEEENVNVRVYQAASPAVVSIDTGDGTGSGSIITPDGLILTNAHVVSQSKSVKVTLADGRQFDADVVAFGNPGTDLAAVKIRGRQSNLPTVRLAATGSVEVGQRAFAIGNPFGQFRGTFTTGIVSRVDSNRHLIQTDAAINPGNSGGPLLNSQGELIGVTTAIFAPRGSAGNVGIGFAIAVDQVQPFLVAVREGRARTEPSANSLLLAGKEPEQIAMGSSPVQGRLDRSSSVLPSDNSYFNAYSFSGKAGQLVLIEMTSGDINPYLILLGPDGMDIAQADGTEAGKKARVVMSLPTDGTYTILANSSASGETGSYNLRLATAGANVEQQGRILLQEQGNLTSRSPVWQEDGSPYQEFTFQGTAGQVVDIAMQSDQFDTYVLLLDPDGKVVGQNDDTSANTSNSSLIVSLPRTGNYRIIANSYDRTGRGRFTLSVRELSIQ